MSGTPYQVGLSALSEIQHLQRTLMDLEADLKDLLHHSPNNAPAIQKQVTDLNRTLMASWQSGCALKQRL